MASGQHPVAIVVGPASTERGVAVGKKTERKKEREGDEVGRMKIPQLQRITSVIVHFCFYGSQMLSFV